MSKKIKTSFFLVFLFVIILGNYTTANAANFKCKAPDKDERHEIENCIGNDYWQTTEEKNCKDEADAKFDHSPEKMECIDSQCYKEISENECLKKYGNYDMEHLINEAIGISYKLLAIVGSVALLFFIIAGIQMIFSGGSEEKIGSARTMMVQTIIGLVIFLSAYLIIAFVQKTLIEEAQEDKNFKLESTQFK
jgi:Type IV secretion system pilin